MPNAPLKTRWQKGESGNPGGRPKEEKEVLALARQHSKEAILRLVDWMKSDNARASVAACNALLDRGFGKPAQAVEHSGNLGLSHEQALAQLEHLDHDAEGETASA